jgi:acetyl esterase/lipase
MRISVFFAFIPVFLTFTGLALSIWSVVPAPNMLLLPLSVGAPEIGVWLLGWSLFSLLSHIIFRQPEFSKVWRWLGIGLSVMSLMLNIHPLLQLPEMVKQADRSMEQALGKNYLATIPPSISTNFRSQPFSFATALRGINSSPVRSQKRIQFATDKPIDQQLALNLYQPITPGKYPGVIQIYGGAWRAGSPNNDEQFSHYLASQGYVVVAIDYRHAPQYRFPAQLDDVQMAIDYVRSHAEQWEIDPERLGIIGRSAGGHLATLAAYQPAAKPLQAVVSYYSPVDLTMGYVDPPVPDPIDSRQVMRDLLGGTPTDLPELYKQASPGQLVNRRLPPTLLIYGGQDHLVESRFGRKLATNLQSFGTPTVFIEIPWANHAFDAIFNGTSNQLALYYTERFLARSLYPQSHEYK